MSNTEKIEPIENPDEPVDRRELMTNLLILVGIIIAAIVRWDLLRNPVMFVVTMGILVAIHEWGHFIAAKSVGVRVYEFALGMGPRLVTYMRRGGTDYTVRALPIGGFVNPKGMQPDDPITTDGINGRRPAERALVYLAGPLMNIILGLLVLTLSGFLIGVGDESKAIIADVGKKSAASQMVVETRNGQPVTGYRKGLQIGDYILEVNGKPITHVNQVSGQVKGRANQTVTMRVRRGGEELTLSGVARETKVESDHALVVTGVGEGTSLAVLPGDQLELIDGKTVEELGKETESPEATVARVMREKAGQPVTLVVWRNSRERLEVTGPAGPLEMKVQPGERFVGILGISPVPGQGPRVSLEESVRQGMTAFRNFFIMMGAMLGNLFTNLVKNPQKAGEGLGGPVAIWVMLGQVGKLPLMYYFNVLASLSLSLAVFNLFPIFVLDGGHMLLLTIEVLRRRRLDPEQQKLAMTAGVVFVGLLFVIIMSKDIMNLVK
jgi:regulator of sigma E protease